MLVKGATEAYSDELKKHKLTHYGLVMPYGDIEDLGHR